LKLGHVTRRNAAAATTATHQTLLRVFKTRDASTTWYLCSSMTGIKVCYLSLTGNLNNIFFGQITQRGMNSYFRSQALLQGLLRRN
jgi:hypothetical protein